jgi:two-component system cell cycle sensor histidine kinase PleC
MFQNNAQGIATQYSSNIWDKHNDAINILNSENFNKLYQNPKFYQFALASINLLKDLPVIKLNIYNTNRQKFLSNNKINVYNLDDIKNSEKTKSLGLTTRFLAMFDSYLLSNSNKSNLLDQVFSGDIKSEYIPFAGFGENDNNLQYGSLIHVLIPIKSTTNTTGKVEGVIEFYYDMSKESLDLQRLQNNSIAGIIIIFISFFAILISVSRKLERLIEKQHEVNIELADAKAKAETESNEKSKFLANISHELRTPLNAIIGFSEIIKTEALGPIGNQQYKDYINDINNSGTHLLSLINDILDYSKAAAEKLQVDSIEIDVTKILLTSMRLVKPRAEEAKVNLVEEIPKGSLILMADAKRLKQAVLNLLSNSVKFTPEGGSVTLTVYIDEELNTLNIQVKDTGIGIAQADISKAMSTFGQVDSKLSRKYEGTGLGLPLTKKLVELMNGKFDIKSELGFGTTVTLIFPYDKTKNM